MPNKGQIGTFHSTPRAGNDPAEVLIRDCDADDLVALEKAMPTRGTGAHASHLARQREGQATFLIAWEYGAPVGSAVIRWNGDRDRDVRAALGDCPEISTLAVAPAWQGHGVGTALVTAAEHRIRQRGYIRAGIGVGEDNPRAARLYGRLGYVDTGLRVTSRYDYPDEHGVMQEIVEHDRVLIKDL